MAITVVGQASAAATSVAIPAHQAGDLVIVSARGTVAPSVPTAGGTVPVWTTLQSLAQFSIGLTVVSFVATAGTTTTGAFTNATHIAVLVLRPGAGNSLLTNAAHSSVGGANNATTIIYPALTLVKTNSTSMGVRIGTRVTASTQLASNGPTSWTEQTEQPATTAALVVYTRAALAANPVADTVTAGASNAAYRAVTVEVEEVVPVTYFGVVARGITVGQATAGTRKTFSSVALPTTFAKAVSGQRTAFGASAMPVTFGKAVDGQIVAPPSSGPGTTLLVSYTPGSDRNDFSGAVGVRLGIGAADIPITWVGARCNGYGGTRTVKLYEWFSGVVQWTATIDYTGKAVGEYAWTAIPPFTLLAGGYYALLMDTVAYDGNVWKNPGPASFASSIVNVYDSYYSGGLNAGSPNSSFIGLDLGFGGAAPAPITYYGATSSSWSFGAVTQAQRKTFGVVALPVAFIKAVIGQRKTFGVVDRSTVFGKAVQGVRKTFGVVARPTTVTITTAGNKLSTVYGVVARSTIFGAVTQGKRTAVGVVARATIFGAVTQGRRKTFGVVALPVIATFATTGKASYFGIVSRVVNFLAATKGGVYRLFPAHPDTVNLLTQSTFDSVAPPTGTPPDPLTSFWDVLRASDQTYCGRYLCGQQWLVNVLLQPQPTPDSSVLVGQMALDTATVYSQSEPDEL